MNKIIKNFSLTKQNIVKKSTVGTLCMVSLILLAKTSCERYEPTEIKEPVKVCDVLNPIKDLPWLEEIVRVQEDYEIPMFLWIYQCNYNDTVGFLLVGAPTLRYYNLKNCEGETVCAKGDSPINCPGVSIDFNSRKLIWLDTVSLFHDPLSTDNPWSFWLIKFIGDYPKKNAESIKIYQCNYRDGVGLIFDYVDFGCYKLVNILGETDWDSRNTPRYDWEIDHENKKLIWEYIKE